jgi:hypothetical protein
MEYVSGSALGFCLREQGKFSEDVAKFFTLQILGGLRYLHSRRIIYRVRDLGLPETLEEFIRILVRISKPIASCLIEMGTANFLIWSSPPGRTGYINFRSLPCNGRSHGWRRKSSVIKRKATVSRLMFGVSDAFYWKC